MKLKSFCLERQATVPGQLPIGIGGTSPSGLPPPGSPPSGFPSSSGSPLPTTSGFPVTSGQTTAPFTGAVPSVLSPNQATTLAQPVAAAPQGVINPIKFPDSG